MRIFYELGEDLRMKGRWHLAGPVDDEQRDEREFIQGKVVNLRSPLNSRIYAHGSPLDFTFTLLQIPIVSPRFANTVRSLVGDQAQWLPVHIDGHEGFEVLNAQQLVRCIDEGRSEFIKWHEEDGRPDKLGGYRMVTRLRLDPTQIPGNLHIFRVMGWKIALIVSQAFVDAIRPLNPIGPKLELVT